MKKLLLSLLGLGAVGCQPQADAPSTLQSVTPAPAASSDTLNMPALSVWHDYLTRPISPSQPITDSLAVRQFWQHHDLAFLLQTTGQALTGFYGADRYRLEVAIASARRDPQNPAIYFLRGQRRFKHQITRFEGKITLTTLNQEPLPTAADEAEVEDNTMAVRSAPTSDEPVRRYSLAGRIVLWPLGSVASELPSQAGSGAGVFRGTAVLEVALTKGGSLREDNPFLQGPTQGGGQKYEGIWTANSGEPSVASVWVADIVGYSPRIFEDLVVGERDVSINPKYAKFGWNELWQNDEWWADAPKPKALL